MPTTTANSNTNGGSTTADVTAKAKSNQLTVDAHVTSTTSHPTNRVTGSTTINASNATPSAPPGIEKTILAPEATASNAAPDAALVVNQIHETTAPASNAAPDAPVFNHSRHAPNTNASALNATPSDDQSHLASVEFATFYNDQSLVIPKEKTA